MSTTQPRKHVVSVVVGGKEIGGWTEYQIDSSILNPADSFSLSRAFDRDAFDLCRPDAPVKVAIDRVPIITGFIDDREDPAADGTLAIRGRCKGGRLVQESAPSVSYEGLRLAALVTKLADPWFKKVSLSNARNRRVMRGRGRKARDSNKVYIDSQVGTKIEPGQMRWQVIAELCEQAGYLAWSSCDGTELILGQPDYDQEAQYHFKVGDSGVLDVVPKDSVGDRYSMITVLGRGAGTDANYGYPVASRAGAAKNNPATIYGEGKDFTAPKRFVIADRHAIASRKDAELRAAREMARRDAGGHSVTVSAAAHGQVVGGTEITIFVPDTIAVIEKPDRGLRAGYLITSCSYRCSREAGETTVLECVPKGAALSL